MRPRIIPVLLIKEGGLYKPVKFKDGVYVGDPINAIRLFNHLEVDEIVVLDISATRVGRGPEFDLIQEIASEAFMPFCYGGGVTCIDHVRKVFRLGVEKVAINHVSLSDFGLLRQASEEFGVQSVVAAMDVKRGLLSEPKIYDYKIAKVTAYAPVEYAKLLEANGAGELLVNSVNRDGVMSGYDLPLVREISTAVSIPIIACGGAGSLQDMKDVVESGADAAAAGSLFVFKSKTKGVLINYPRQSQLSELFERF